MPARHHGASAFALALLLCTGGCGNALRWEGPPLVHEAATGSPATSQARAAAVARKMVGVPYQWGGATPQGFDCSGLVKYAYNKAGLSVPRTSRAQYGASRHIALGDARVGDLVFFRFGPRVSHVGIYLGDGRFVHAPSSGKRVEIATLSQPPYSEAFVTAGRIDRVAAR